MKSLPYVQLSFFVSVYKPREQLTVDHIVVSASSTVQLKNELLETVETISQIIDWGPEDSELPDLYRERGNILDELDDYAGAISDYKKALELEPADYMTWNDLGVVTSKLGDFCGAINAFNQSVHLNPADGNVFFNRGLAYKNNGNLKLALDDFNAAVSKCPEMPRTYYHRGLVLLSLGFNQMGEDDLRKARELQQRIN